MSEHLIQSLFSPFLFFASLKNYWENSNADNSACESETQIQDTVVDSESVDSAQTGKSSTPSWFRLQVCPPKKTQKRCAFDFPLISIYFFISF